MPVETVSEYLQGQPPKNRAVLKKVRAILRKALPDADEVISYQIPAYKLDGKPVIYFAGWKSHYSVYPMPRAWVAAQGERLAGYELSKGTLRLPLDGAVPVKLLTDLARFRVREVSGPKAASSSKPRRKVGTARRSPKAPRGSVRASR